MDGSWVNFIFVTLVLHQEFGHITVEGFCSSEVLSIPNGSYYHSSGTSLVRFECDRGFLLYGVEHLACLGSQWSSDPPLCIANTCSEIVPTAALLVRKEYEGAVLKFTCAAMYKLNGTSKLVCDGTDWSHRQPTCDPWTPPLSCDFEKADICGWLHDETGDQEWTRNSGSTPTSKTGPSYDHTYGKDGNVTKPRTQNIKTVFHNKTGCYAYFIDIFEEQVHFPSNDRYYMFFETSSPVETNHKAILMSPLYAANYSKPKKCVKFFYHIHGEKDIGVMEVFIKPKSTDLTFLTPSFEVGEASGDVWIEHTLSIPQQTEPFQIVFAATRGSSYRSDFAIDDVELNDCMAPKKTTTVFSSTHKVSTVLPTTPLPTSATPVPITPMKTGTPATKTAPPIITSKPDYTTIAHVKTTRSFKETTFKPRKTSVVTTKAEMGTESTTLKPVINPDLHLSKSHVTLKEDRHNKLKILYIIIGVGLVLTTTGLVGVGMYCYRRRLKLRRLPIDSLSSSNPLYRAVNGEEAIRFVMDPYQN